MDKAIVVQDLVKTYGDVQAVGGVSFYVERGEIFGMVGPNGAGKTTTIECLEGLRRQDSGTVSVLGLDPWRQGYELRKRIGVQLQTAGLPDRLKVWEALDLFASFFDSTANLPALLDLLGLSEKRNSPISKLSGGQRQRVFIALSLVSHPELVFLDELTTGLDPQARRAMWDLVRQIRSDGRTVFLTTHYMEEAERLCDRVLILDYGKIVAMDTPESLVASLGIEKRIIFTVPEDAPDVSLADLPGVDRCERVGERIIVQGKGDRLASQVVNAMDEAQVTISDLRTEQPDLEDVFLALTGRHMREA